MVLKPTPFRADKSGGGYDPTRPEHRRAVRGAPSAEGVFPRCRLHHRLRAPRLDPRLGAARRAEPRAHSALTRDCAPARRRRRGRVSRLHDRPASRRRAEAPGARDAPPASGRARNRADGCASGTGARPRGTSRGCRSHACSRSRCPCARSGCAGSTRSRCARSRRTGTHRSGACSGTHRSGACRSGTCSCCHRARGRSRCRACASRRPACTRARPAAGAAAFRSATASVLTACTAAVHHGAGASRACSGSARGDVAAGDRVCTAAASASRRASFTAGHAADLCIPERLTPGFPERVKPLTRRNCRAVEGGA